MKPDRHGHMGIPLVLLCLACAAFAMTGKAPYAGATRDQEQNQQYGPFLQAKIISISTPARKPVNDSETIKDLITQQLDAISARDADLAYALMTGTFHKKFDTAGKFLSEMRFSYRPVYNHESFRFLDQTETETGGLIQRVEVSYTHGDPVIVIYKLQRDPEGDWGIDSFTILDTEDGQPI